LQDCIIKKTDKFDFYIYEQKIPQMDIDTFLEMQIPSHILPALSFKKSMKWDEDTFNLEYGLEIFSIVAVADFNFGAMENKSLNIFNEA
jgi:glycyl-tRNA synthetase beta subunit